MRTDASTDPRNILDKMRKECATLRAESHAAEVRANRAEAERNEAQARLTEARRQNGELLAKLTAADRILGLLRGDPPSALPGWTWDADRYLWTWQQSRDGGTLEGGVELQGRDGRMGWLASAWAHGGPTYLREWHADPLEAMRAADSSLREALAEVKHG